MSNNPPPQVPDSEFIGSSNGSTLAAEYNMSVTDVPADWLTAEQESPTTHDDRPLSRSARIGGVPTGHHGAFISNIGALGGAFIGGVLWYALDALDLYQGPWIAVFVGAIIGIAIRAGAGGESGYRAVLSAASFLLTLLIVLIALTHDELTTIYGTVSDLQTYEQTLVRTRLQDPLHLLAYGIGLLTAGRIASLRVVRS